MSDVFQKIAFNCCWMFVSSPVWREATQRPLFVWTRAELRNSLNWFYLKTTCEKKVSLALKCIQFSPKLENQPSECVRWVLIRRFPWIVTTERLSMERLFKMLQDILWTEKSRSKGPDRRSDLLKGKSDQMYTYQKKRKRGFSLFLIYKRSQEVNLAGRDEAPKTTETK